MSPPIRSQKKSCTLTLCWCFYLMIMLISCASSTPPQPHPQPRPLPMPPANVLVSIDPRAGVAVPSDLVGFSIETDQLCTVLQLADENPAYAQLYTNLGSSVLRIGGNSVDTSTWEPDGIASCSADRTIVTKGMIHDLFAFALRIHWQIIWGLNLALNDPDLIASEASYIARAGHARLLGFTIGNEPELYAQRGIRPGWWGADNYLYEWRNYQRSILRSTRATLIGPEACCGTPLFTEFSHDPSTNGMTIISHHLYGISNTTQGVTLYPSIPLLLSRFTLRSEERLLDQWANEARSGGKTLELTEVNSVSGGGAAGISNTLAAALWATDLLGQSAMRSLRQVDFHNAPGALYNAIDDQGQALPLYYSLLLFHFATRNTHIQTTTTTTTLNLSTYAFQDNTGGEKILIVNKEPTRHAYVHITLSQSFKQANAVSLMSPALAATGGIQLSQRTLSGNNTWTPQPSPLPWQGQAGTVMVPPGSELLVMLR